MLLHSTWVDLHSEHIIWYALIQSFRYEVLPFSFLFISVESLKNHNKLKKNHKIENLILLYSPHEHIHTAKPAFTVATIVYCSTRLQNRSREVKCTVRKVEGSGLPGFGVEGGIADFHES
jgi:hypothetical protein